MFVDALGSGLYLPLTLVFIHEVTGLSATSVGLAVTVAAAAGLVANPLAGILIDRFGSRSILIGTYLLRALGFALYPLVGSFPALIAVAALIAVGDRAYYPATSSYTAAIASGADRDRLYSYVAMARNVGFGLGGLLSTAALSVTGDHGFVVMAVVNAASFVGAAGCLAFASPRLQTELQQNGAAPRQQHGGYRAILSDRPFLSLVGAEQAFTLVHSVLPVALPVYVVVVLGAPPAVLGVLYTLNTLLLVVGQLPVRKLQAKARRTHALALGGAVFAASCGAYAAVAYLPEGGWQLTGLVAATLVYTAGELMHTAPSSALAAAIAPPAVRGRYLAVYQLTWAVSGILAPAGFSALLDVATPLLWVVLVFLLVVACVMVLRLSGRLPAAAVFPQSATATAVQATTA
ncbi:MFS transporter [Streptomyces scopuliridis]|uniref:MFS transporter n=1 Tax=Streptomyces scopuliridis TaxID=452529 RepID=UPI002DD8AD38|nr:MFS transporter [Streptomyces scopuliridis]WSB32123.1 MFS transporter [Streptomyces scopuliridis]